MLKLEIENIVDNKLERIKKEKKKASTFTFVVKNYNSLSCDQKPFIGTP